MVQGNLRCASFLRELECTITVGNDFAGKASRRRINTIERKFPLTATGHIEQGLIAVVGSNATVFKAEPFVNTFFSRYTANVIDVQAHTVHNALSNVQNTGIRNTVCNPLFIGCSCNVIRLKRIRRRYVISTTFIYSPATITSLEVNVASCSCSAFRKLQVKCKIINVGICKECTDGITRHNDANVAISIGRRFNFHYLAAVHIRRGERCNTRTREPAGSFAVFKVDCACNNLAGSRLTHEACRYGYDTVTLSGHHAIVVDGQDAFVGRAEVDVHTAKVNRLAIARYRCVDVRAFASLHVGILIHRKRPAKTFCRIFNRSIFLAIVGVRTVRFGHTVIVQVRAPNVLREHRTRSRIRIIFIRFNRNVCCVSYVIFRIEISIGVRSFATRSFRDVRDTYEISRIVLQIEIGNNTVCTVNRFPIFRIGVNFVFNSTRTVIEDKVELRCHVLILAYVTIEIRIRCDEHTHLLIYARFSRNQVFINVIGHFRDETQTQRGCHTDRRTVHHTEISRFYHSVAFGCFCVVDRNRRRSYRRCKRCCHK